MYSHSSDQTQYEVFDDLPLTEHIEWNHQHVEGFYQTALNPFFWIKSQTKYFPGNKNRRVFESPEKEAISWPVNSKHHHPMLPGCSNS